MALLNLLSAFKIPVAVASATLRKITVRYPEKSNVQKYFQIVVCSNEVAKSKAARDIFLKTAHLLDLSVEQCLAVEDSQNGILAAHRAGALPMLVKDIQCPSTFALIAIQAMQAFPADTFMQT